MKAIVLLTLIAILAVSFLCTAGLVWIVCWAFSLMWNWKVAIGIWAALFLISGSLKTTVTRK